MCTLCVHPELHQGQSRPCWALTGPTGQRSCPSPADRPCPVPPGLPPSLAGTASPGGLRALVPSMSFLREATGPHTRTIHHRAAKAMALGGPCRPGAGPPTSLPLQALLPAPPSSDRGQSHCRLPFPTWLSHPLPRFQRVLTWSPGPGPAPPPGRLGSSGHEDIVGGQSWVSCSFPAPWASDSHCPAARARLLVPGDSGTRPRNCSMH